MFCTLGKATSEPTFPCKRLIRCCLAWAAVPMRPILRILRPLLFISLTTLRNTVRFLLIPAIVGLVKEKVFRIASDIEAWYDCIPLALPRLKRWRDINEESAGSSVSGKAIIVDGLEGMSTQTANVLEPVRDKILTRSQEKREELNFWRRTRFFLMALIDMFSWKIDLYAAERSFFSMMREIATIQLPSTDIELGRRTL